ncbi:MAG: ribosome recycling factor [Dehalococcoidia bacterium]|nr:ribosome recycling factor [Dehalococcoidia bacterium]
MTDEILLEAEDRMDKALEAYQRDLATLRTGRASTALVEHLPVKHYGQTMALNQLATLAAPEAQLITIQPWDRGTVDSIIKAIQTSDLGINPSSDGAIIRLPIPPLTEQRRRDLVKQLHSRTEEARVAVRNGRRHAIDELRKSLREHEISEDEEHGAQASVEKLATAHIAKLDDMGARKERELLAV